MKRMILFAGVLLILMYTGHAQTAGKSSQGQKRSVHHKTTADKSNQKKASNDTSGMGTTYSLSSTGNHQAFSGNSGVQRLDIQDPTVRALDARANGENIRISNSGVVGMPRGAYGFAKGRLTFRTTDATSTGANTGSGSVATGTSPGSLGISGATPNVNGKSPYAGASIWGAAIAGPDVQRNDSAVKRIRAYRHN